MQGVHQKVQNENKDPEALQRPAWGMSGTMDSARTRALRLTPASTKGHLGHVRLCILVSYSPASQLATLHIHLTHLRPPTLSSSRPSLKSRNHHLSLHNAQPGGNRHSYCSDGELSLMEVLRHPHLCPTPSLPFCWLILFGRLGMGCWWPMLSSESPSLCVCHLPG